MKVFAALLCTFLLLGATVARANGSGDDERADAAAAKPVTVARAAEPTPPPGPLLPARLPQITHFQTPTYPEIAWQSHTQGKVSLKILVYRDGRFDFSGSPEGNPALVSAAKENLCSWNFAHNDSVEPLPLTVQFDYRIDKVRTSAQRTTQVTYDLPNRVTVVAPAYAPSCLCIKKRSRWKLWSR